MKSSLTRIAVVGAGTIGASWSALFLASGREVAVYDPADTVEPFVRDYLRRAWPTLAELDLVAPGADPERLCFHNTPEAAVIGAEFVQESAPEQIELKHRLYKRIEPYLDSCAIVGSSASGLMLSELQAGFADPSRLVLAHPFNPPHLIPLVELLANEKTAAGVLSVAESLYASCGRITIRLNREVPGHVANRLQAALWREAIHLAIEGVASVADIDKAVWAGPGLRWSAAGPHQLFDLGAGPAGIGVFCERYGPSFHRWWDDLGDPRLDADTVDTLCQGVDEATGDASFTERAAYRDALITATLKATAPLRHDD